MVKCESLRINMYRITHTGKSVNFPVTKVSKMQTEDCRPGVKCGLVSKTTRFPGKTSRVSWDRRRVSRERLAIIVTSLPRMVLALTY